MTAPATRPQPPRRVRSGYVDWLDERLSARDWHVVETVNRLRTVSGLQLERLCFGALAEGRSRTVTRSRVLARLVAWRVLMPVGRRVGGSGRGSTVQAFALDSGGQRLMERRHLAAAQRGRVRRAEAPGERTTAHLLAVSEVYTTLVEASRAENVTLDHFAAEPGAWWPNGLGGRLKPDAYAVLARPGARDHWWIEVDQATESLPTLRTKVQTYLDFQRRGERGPDDVMPWVLISTVTERRRDAIAAMVRRLPEARELVTVVHSSDAAAHMLKVLRE
jgi:hypothetical protein